MEIKLGFIESLVIILVLAKLLGAIKIGWLLVFTPLLIFWGCIFAIILAGVIYAGLHKTDSPTKRNSGFRRK